VYGPLQVSASQIHTDLMTPKFAWDHPGSPRAGFPLRKDVDVVTTSEEAVTNAHALCVLTEWDEFKAYDYQKIYDGMIKPAFIFDGRNILDHAALRKIGFVVYALGKPLDDFIRKPNQ
jgi:UDPglucose 6-dehydrogenase